MLSRYNVLCSILPWLLILIQLCHIKNTKADDPSCEAETLITSSGSFTWDGVYDAGNQLYVSRQLRCLDEFKFYVTRKCESTGWVPVKESINCPYFIDESILSICPPDYKFLTFDPVDYALCYKSSFESLRDPQQKTCLQYPQYSISKLEDDARALLNKQLGIDNLSSIVRLPASNMWFTTDMVEVENPIGWNIPNGYGEPVSEIYKIDDSLRGMDSCLTLDLETDEYFATTCNQYQEVCMAYVNPGNDMYPKSCSEGRTSKDARLQHYCVFIQKFSPEPIADYNDDTVKEKICENVFTINSGYALKMFLDLSNMAGGLDESDRCLFKILPNKIMVTPVVWQSEFNEVEFINWSLETTLVVGGMDEYLTIKSNGEWVWTTGTFTCAVCFHKNNNIQMPVMKFDPNHEEKVLWLRVENGNSLTFSLLDSIGCATIIYESNTKARIKSCSWSLSGGYNDYKIVTNGYPDGWYQCHGVYDATPIGAEILFRMVKFAITVTTVETDSQETIENRFKERLITKFGTYFQIDEVVLVWSYERKIFLFHVNLWIINNEYLRFEENRINLSHSILPAYYVQQKLNNITLNATDLSDLSEENFYISSYNSTEYCLPMSISQLHKINFAGSRIEYYLTSNEMCLLQTKLPITRRCVGDDFFGGTWNRELELVTNCSNHLESNVTLMLHNLLHSNLSANEKVDEMIEIVLETCVGCLIAADIFYISQIMDNFKDVISDFPVTDDLLSSVFQLYNRLLMVNETVTNRAASLNATNVLLDVLDVVLITVARTESNNTRTFIEPMIASFLFYPHISNVTGVAMINNANETNIKWNNLHIRYLHPNDTETNIANISNLIIASYLPEALLSSLTNPYPYPPVVITLFINDILFQTVNVDGTTKNSIRMNGKVLSVMMPSTIKNDTSNLKYKLPIFVSPPDYNESYISGVCGYWDFANTIDGWSMNGCSRNDLLTTSTTVLCECTHLTHFTCLFNGYTEIPSNHLTKLKTITIVGCSLSLTGVACIYVTAIVFEKWRSSSSNKTLLQFSTAIGFQMIIVLFVNTEELVTQFLMTDELIACIAVGAATHYFVLVTFSWMLIISYMQFKRYVTVFYSLTSHFLIKSTLIGWAIPAIIVVLVLSTNRSTYIPDAATDSSKICYPTGYALYFSVMTPICLITLVNLLNFLFVVKHIVVKNDKVQSHHNKSLLLSKLRLSIFLFFLLGLTWCFAFLSMTRNGIVFNYLFCISGTLQGFIIYFYFIILDPLTLQLWTNLFKKMFNCFHK